MIIQHELIKSLQTHREKTAILHNNGKDISYSELWRTSSRITRFLLDRQLEKETMVGIYFQDRADLICAMTGVLNARCTFVPLDGNLPARRLAAILEDTGLKYVISSKGHAKIDFFSHHPAISCFFIEDVVGQTTNEEADNMVYPVYDSQDSIYVYFTSGTTGRPKGIVGKNDSLLQFIQWEIEKFSISPGARFSQLISPYFDAFLRDVFVPLMAGGTICIPPAEEEFFSSANLITWIDNMAINLIHCVPSVFRLINNESLSVTHFKQLRYVLLSGEKIIPSELVNWYELFDGAIQLVNLYGPTETTMIRTCYEIRPQDVDLVRMPIGSPIPGTKLVILNEELRPCNRMIPGDLYIISDYTSKGYLNDPELTAQKFIKLNAGRPDEVTAFKTGDKARVLTNGQIDLIGREDRQIKLRGVRIEMDEVEAVILQSGLVKNAVVVCHAGANGNENDGALTAFVIPKDGDAGDTGLADVIRQFLGQSLPAYMVPPTIISVDQYPLLGNGKINYQELLSRLNEQPLVAPTDETESKLLDIWKEILGDKPISTTDNFLSSGGTSLSIMRLIARIYKEMKIRISLDQLFTNLTIQRQADIIRNSPKENRYAIPVIAKKAAYQLSSAQERIYYHYELDKMSTAFNLPMAWEIKAAVEEDRIDAAFRALVSRHETLRTEFRYMDGKIHQLVHETVDFKIEKLTCDEKDIDLQVASFIRPFELDNAPLIRAAILSAGTKNILLVDIHHLVCDGLSQMILLTDFIRLYKGESLKPLPIQYKDYAEWEYNFKRTEEYIDQRGFWLKSFDGTIPSIEWPTAGAGAIPATNKGGNLLFKIERDTIRPIAESLGAEGITLFSGFFSLFFIYLSRLTGQDDLVIGINTYGRMQEEVHEVVGMFAKTLPIRYQIDAECSFKTFARDMHKHLVLAQNKQVYDLSDIVNDLNRNRNTLVKELIGAMLVYQTFENKEVASAEDEFAVFEFENTTSKYPMTLFVNEGRDAFYLRWEYLQHYFTRSDMELLVEQFIALVKTIAGDMDRPMTDYNDTRDAGKSPALREELIFHF